MLSAGLDLAGIVDPTGVADAANVALQVKNKEWVDAAISTAGLIPYLGDVAKVFKIGNDYRIIQRAISQIRRNRQIGKIAEEQVTSTLLKRFGKDATVSEQISAKFKDGSKVVFDNIVVKNNKVIFVNETKSGNAVLSNNKSDSLKMVRMSHLLERKAGSLGLKGIQLIRTPLIMML